MGGAIHLSPLPLSRSVFLRGVASRAVREEAGWGGGWGKVSEQQAWESGASLDGSVKVGLGGLRTPGLHPSCPSLAFPTGLISGCPVAPFLLSGEGEGVG